jgi:TonB-dependent receptor
MLDLPLFSSLDVIGGVRFESTEIGIVNDPEAGATWLPPGEVTPTQLNPGDADVDFDQDDWLPSIALVYDPVEEVTLRASYARTVARQTFKELSPILQQEFLGGPIFIGNPTLGMSQIDNYDLRVDYRPYQGGLFSVSWFYKDVKDPIEYVQRAESFTFTTPVNFPKGNLSGFELETRQDLGWFWEPLEGLSVGANATFIDSEVTLSEEEQLEFSQPSIMAPIVTRDMTNAPEHLYNLFVTYDIERTGTQASVFYTVQGDTLVAGAGQTNSNLIPSIYATEFGTLNVTVAQRLGEYFKLQFQAKNLTDPKIKTVYRSFYTGGDVTNTSFTRGVDYSLSLSAEFNF